MWIQKNPELIHKLLQRPYAAIGISYLLAIDEKNNSDDIIKALLETNPKKNKTIMNAAEQLIDRGRQQGIELGIEKGIQKGVQKGKIEVAKYMLFQLSLDINTIRLATGLSIQELKKLAAGSY